MSSTRFVRLNAITPKGASVNSAENGWPWTLYSSAVTPPRFPLLLPA
jgi:hypothetical protein